MLRRRFIQTAGITAAVIAAGCAPLVSAIAQSPPPMLWGVNIHKSYANLNQAGVLALAASLGLKSIRVDVYDGGAATVSYLAGLIAAAAPYGIGIVPVLVPNAAASNTETNAYNWGYAQARALATAFPQMTWEAGNELDQFCGIPGNTGESMSHFDPAKYALCRGSIKGMRAGFKSKSAQPVGVGIAGRSFGFFDLLKRDGVQWDITTWHIYITSDTSAADIAAGADLYLTRLAGYGKPIAITEFNQQDGHLSTASPQTLLDMMTAIQSLAVSKNVVAAYIYELLDEPHLAGGEATYGLADSYGNLNALGHAVKAKLLPA